MLNVHSDDFTPKARIRDAALRLFADEGFEAVTVRRIAAAAEVSPALVLHHYGSKDGLRTACDEHVLGLFDGLLGEAMPSDAELAETLRSQPDQKFGSFGELFPGDSPVMPYLRRMLLTDDHRARAVLRGWYDLTLHLLLHWRDAGLIDPGPDPQVRAAALLAMDLGGVLLRGPLTEILGFDPLAPEGIDRWGGDMYSLFALMLTPQTKGTP